MDYEKAYKAVLQTATQWIKDGCTDKEKICLECVFPELRESEDERIRKGLVNFLQSPFIKENLTDEKVAPWLAYLEKQKEPHYTKRSALFDKCVAECDPAVMKEVSDEIDEMLEKEQKPTSTEDMYITDEHFYEREPVDSFKYKLAEYMTRCCTKKEGPYGYEYGISADTILKMAEEELLKRGVVQKPVEWNPEDEQNLNVCLSYIKDEPLRRWLKDAIHVRYVKPAEWSEEDEKMRVNILNALTPQLVYSVGKGTYTGTSTYKYDDEIKWLKSLRPQPNKEIYQAAKHDLAIRFMNYLDENRPEGKMGLSNGECEDIDNAFKENDWAKIIRYYEKYGRRD